MEVNSIDWMMMMIFCKLSKSLPEAPEFLSRNSDNQTELTKVIQPESTTVQLKCLATGKPTPEIRWKKNGKILSEDEYGITQ